MEAMGAAAIAIAQASVVKPEKIRNFFLKKKQK